MSIIDNIKYFEHLKQGFRGTISWNKDKSEMRTEPKNINLNCMIDPKFRHINRLFIASFRNDNDYPARNYFDEFSMPLVEIKDFHALIDNEQFFDQPVKTKQEAYERLVEITKNNDYTTGNLLDYLYHKNNYKLISIVSSRQTNTTIP